MEWLIASLDYGMGCGIEESRLARDTDAQHRLTNIIAVRDMHTGDIIIH